jgi:protease-4
MIFTFLYRLIASVFRLVFWPLLYLRWRRAVRPGTYLAFEIDGGVTDIQPPPKFMDRFRKRPLSLAVLAELTQTLGDDRRVQGIVVTLRSFQQGMASALSFHNALRKVRESGREVVVYLPLGGGTKELFVASAATKIVAAPQTTLSPLGFVVTARYLKGALERAHLEPEVYARGVYKSAGEQLTRNGMSEREREQQDAILDQLFEVLLAKLAEGRRWDIERARSVVDNAPYLHSEALENGLADAAAYEDELKTAIGDRGPATLAPAGGYLRTRRALSFPSLRSEPGIGVLKVHGAIASTSPLTSQLGLATDDALIGAVRLARRDPSVRALILHINSPGGGALASDRIHHELAALAAEKPLIAYMANVAASGGYYVAAPAHAIIAQPTTITGSIGVVAARFAIDPLLERLGISTEVLKRGEHADLIAPTRSLRDDERAVIERELEGMYRAFLKVVADGRKQPIESIAKVAEGRVWIGSDAKRVGLVDELGGFEVAVEAARSRIKGSGAAKLKPFVVTPPGGRIPPLDPPGAQRGAAGAAGAQALLGIVHLARTLGVDIEPAALLLGGERILAWCPRAKALAGSDESS